MSNKSFYSFYYFMNRCQSNSITKGNSMSFTEDSLSFDSISQNFLYINYILQILYRDEVSRIEEESRLEMEEENQNQENSKESNSNKVIDPVSTLSPEQRKVYNTALDGYV